VNLDGRIKRLEATLGTAPAGTAGTVPREAIDRLPLAVRKRLLTAVRDRKAVLGIGSVGGGFPLSDLPIDAGLKAKIQDVLAGRPWQD
jgi:hypothetical protein